MHRRNKLTHVTGMFLLTSVLSLIGLGFHWLITPKSCDKLDMKDLEEITEQIELSRGISTKGIVKCVQPVHWKENYYPGLNGLRYFRQVKHSSR